MKKYIILIMITLAVDLFAQQTIKDYITNQWEDSRYTDHVDGTVTDTKTGLMWKQCSEGQSAADCATGAASTLNWKDALELAKTSTFAGHSDWRVPNIKELISLAAQDRFNPAINLTLFPNTPANKFFWSSSPNAANSDEAWRLKFYSGLDTYFKRNNIGQSVRLVRLGQ